MGSSSFADPHRTGVFVLKTLPLWFWLAALSTTRAPAASSFVNFETAPIHPAALSPDHDTLAICNGDTGHETAAQVSAGGGLAAGVGAGDQGELE